MECGWNPPPSPLRGYGGTLGSLLGVSDVFVVGPKAVGEYDRAHEGDACGSDGPIANPRFLPQTGQRNNARWCDPHGASYDGRRV